MNFAEKLRHCRQNRVAPRPDTSKMKIGSICRAAPWFFATAAVFAGGQANAAAISVNDVFQTLEQASVNDIGASTAPVLFIGADDVVPNGFTTTGVATSADASVSNHRLLTRAIAEEAISRTPNIFEPKRIYVDILLEERNFAKASEIINWMRGKVNAPVDP